MAIFLEKTFAAPLDLECSYHMTYPSNVIEKSKAYIKNNPGKNNTIYYEAKFYIGHNKKNEKLHETIIVDLENKKIIGNLASWIVMNDLVPMMQEFNDKLFIDYYSPLNKPVEKIILNRIDGSFTGIKFTSAPSLDPVFKIGEISYYLSGKCQPIKTKRII